MRLNIRFVPGAIALAACAYVTVFAVEDVQRLTVGERYPGGTAETVTWTVCSSGCDFNSVQVAVDGANNGDTIELGAETFYENVVVPEGLDCTIRGSGQMTTTIDGGGIAEVIYALNATLRLEDLTVRNGGATGVLASYLVMEDCLVTDNHQPWAGAGGVSAREMVIRRSTISDNTALLSQGGGVFVQGSGGSGWTGKATIVESTIAGNMAAIGGGINAWAGEIYIDSSTISNNVATEAVGGGIQFGCGSDLAHRLTLVNSTLSGNSARNGGAIHNCWGTVTISNSTVVGNSASWQGGGIFNRVDDYGDYVLVGEVHFVDVILASDSPDNCSSPEPEYFMGRGANFADDDSCSSTFETITGLDPVLRDNGGPTQTHALLPGSSAIDVGSDQCPASDQRGIARPQDGDGNGVAECDAGAYEYQRQVVEVQIDIKPDSSPDSVNPRSQGVIPVALLGSDTFDVSDIDVSTLSLGPGGATPAHGLTDSFNYNGHLRDVNFDGYMDLVTHYRTRDTGVACGDSSLTLTGVFTTLAPCIDFVPANPLPGANSVTARKSSDSDCDALTLDVVVSQVDDVYSAVFDVAYPVDLATFNQASNEGSHLSVDGAQVVLLTSEQHPGEAVVATSRLGTLSGIDFLDDFLLRLSFDQVGATGTAPLDFTNARLIDSTFQTQGIPGISWFGGVVTVEETDIGNAFSATDSIRTVGCKSTRRPSIWIEDQDTPDTLRRGGPVDIGRK